MKATTLTLLFILVSILIFGQKSEYGSHTIVGSKEKIITSYISFDGQFSNLLNKDFLINKDDVTCSGGVTIASTIDHAFTIGITTSWIFDYPQDLDTNKILAGYFGILLEPTIFGKFPIHVTFPCVVGVSGFTYINNDNDNSNIWITPIFLSGGARLELNVADGVRLSLGPSWRYISNKNDHDNRILDKLFDTMSLDFSIKIGKY